MRDLVRRYAMLPVPRYTSYPTAPHWKPGFPAETWASWLGSLDRRQEVSLYLHVPFCRQMCWYCGCNMKLAARPEPVSDYARALAAEIDLVAGILPGRFRVGHLHWGGGTPTALSEDDLARLMDRIRARFDVTSEAEVAIESDPRTLTAGMAARIGALGFTRASFGVQEFDPKVQGAINRIQPPEMVAQAVERLRAGGVGGINFDLIYGLPHQTQASLLETIRICNGIGPDRIALFGYAHVPWMAKNQRMIDAEALPGIEERAAQAEGAARALRHAGFDAVGLDHFARPWDELAVAARQGRLRRNFQGYTTDQAATLLGFGATSISSTEHGFVQNEAETGAWSRSVSEGRLPVAKGLALQGEDRLRRAAIEWLMCQGMVDTAALAAGFGAPEDWAQDAMERLAPMQADGLVEIEDGQVMLTERGRPFARVAASAFDTYLAAGQARHSVAV